jgi:hypothetical protein
MLPAQQGVPFPLLAILRELLHILGMSQIPGAPETQLRERQEATVSRLLGILGLAAYRGLVVQVVLAFLLALRESMGLLLTPHQ